MISPCGVRSRALAPEFTMTLSGFRVCCTNSGLHEITTRTGRLRPDEGLPPNFPVATPEEPGYDLPVGVVTRLRVWKSSNNSAYPIQRECSVSSLLRRLSDSQAQPSKGTQGNNGSNSPLAGGIKSRAVRSHLSLALGEFVRRNSRSPRRGNGQVSPKIEGIRRSEVRGSASVISFGAAKSEVQVSSAFAQAFTTSV